VSTQPSEEKTVANYKMTYPYARVFPGLGQFEPGEVVAFEENPDGHFFEQTTDPVGKPSDGEAASEAAAPPAVATAIPDASEQAATTAAEHEGN
jgi:hypothetical protein